LKISQKVAREIEAADRGEGFEGDQSEDLLFVPLMDSVSSVAVLPLNNQFYRPGSGDFWG
jgi:hypothetical protein